MLILALDPGKRTGVAIGEPGKRPRLLTFNFGRDLDDPEDVFVRAMKWIERALDGALDLAFDEPMGKPTVLAIEAPVPPSGKFGFTNFDTTLATLGMSVIFRTVARSRGIPVKLAPINSWRKYALGRGNLKGKDAKAGMIRLVKGLGWGDHDHNACEAAGVWLWACGQIAPQRVTRHEPLFLERDARS
jgi:hypothetical protein